MRAVAILAVTGLAVRAACGGPESASPARGGRDPVSFEAGPAIFPARWRAAPFHGRAVPLPDAQRERARRIVARALGKYPPGFADRTLATVYLVGALHFHGNQQFSGTASSTDVYLVVRAAEEGYSDAFVEAVFHREYSTLLLNRFLAQFDRDAWCAVNPPGFRYLGGNSWDGLQGKDGGSRAIEEGAADLTPQRDPAALAAGFLAGYARSSLENDFNEYAAALFMNEPAFWAKAERYRGVAEKCRLAAAFYQALDPAFTVPYFRGL